MKIGTSKKIERKNWSGGHVWEGICVQKYHQRYKVIGENNLYDRPRHDLSFVSDGN
jgi:hypothetical protein